jgi:hypothetical protein
MSYLTRLGIRRAFAFEGDPQAVVLGVDGNGLGLQHDLVEAAGVLLFPDLDRVAIRALHQAIHHFDDIDFGAQGGIDGGHFEADDAAADDQHLLRHEAQFERPGRIDDARVFRDEGQMHRRRAGGDDALLELDDLLAPVLSWPVPVGDFDLDVVRIEEVP